MSGFFLSSPAALKGRRGLPDGEDQVAFENLSRSLLNPGARAGWPGGPGRPGSALPPAAPWGTWPVLMFPDRRACARDRERILEALERTHASFSRRLGGAGGGEHERGGLSQVGTLRPTQVTWPSLPGPHRTPSTSCWTVSPHCLSQVLVLSTQRRGGGGEERRVSRPGHSSGTRQGRKGASQRKPRVPGTWSPFQMERPEVTRADAQWNLPPTPEGLARLRRPMEVG